MNPEVFLMKGMRIAIGILAVVFFVWGYVMAATGSLFGQTVFLAGAIITTGVLISSAILEASDKV
jgi:hypothetical protein